ncbi:hypothetical protein [Paenibacillus antibioticophila]|uniref:hypothetical protein n=1 Tax=Paenibacillus antibioticophila TaxID=1274374 RepID=UPI0005C97817|nr:hypothetical protein [Paenibacillus antibioticophila]
MIFWRGLGFLSIFIPAAVFAVITIVFNLFEFDTSRIDAQLPLAFSLIVGGVIVWHLGKKLNADSNKVLVDQETGQQYRLGVLHSFYFIPMQNWGLIGLIGGFILIINSIFRLF